MCCTKKPEEYKEQRKTCGACDGKGYIKNKDGSENLCNTCGGRGNVPVVIVNIKR